ncbi:MAG TPA: bifunctional serine/threonine-protein kinase/formylglycine-generating enzyme family protein [Blastocatellia bacterium]|nr:bifunctional serine/threonine-protein kinase/formylglycine-generating enzyme family protein [Blastocatellia bacterium]
MKICPQCGSASDDPIEVCAVDHSGLLSIDANADPMLGKLLDDKYRLIRKIGEGGMGSVYRAVHTGMARTEAVKLLPSLSPGKDDAVARFKREAKMASHIDNVHAVTIYDFGQTDDGMLFLAMEFINGQPLSRVIAEERVLAIDRVVHITNQIAEALAAAHALGIVHRDLKPDNVMITRKGADADFVKVLDFGIAKAVADDEGENLTKTGFVLGTPVYMSPEQLLGEKLDPRSDIYSLAIIVYEMLSGRLPFEGDNPQAVMMKRVMSDPIRLRAVASSISESVEQAVMVGLARNRERRTPDVETFALELSRSLHIGTQQMGAAITSRLADAGAARETREVTGVMTSASGSQTASPSGALAWAPTEMSQAVVPPQVIEQTASPPITDRDRVSNVRDNQITTKQPPRANKVVWAGSLLGIVIVAAVLYVAFASGSSAGFTLVVKGAPPGSQISVNESRRDAVVANGGLKVVGLEPGTAHVRVSHEGYADFVTTVTGVKGEVQSCEAELLPEINYPAAMVPIPADVFEMGSDKFEDDERPAHSVSLPAYYIDKYEVTNAQYKQFCDDTHRKYPPDPSFEPNYFSAKPQYPVLGVTFEDALAYASWAGKRLPTEQEWEKAASWDPVSRRKRLYPWGDESAEGNIGTGKPAPVAEANGDRSPYGVFNMGGNALEWVDAAYKPYPGNEKPDPAYQKDERVVRGASFLQAINKARTSYRDHLPRIFPEGKSTPVGLRCAISANDPRIQSLVHERSK